MKHNFIVLKSFLIISSLLFSPAAIASEQKKTEHLAHLLKTEDPGLTKDVAGLTAASLGAILRYCMLPMVFKTAENFDNGGDGSKKGVLLFLAACYVLESTLGLAIYKKVVTDSGGSHDLKSLIVGIGGTPGTALYSLYHKYLLNNNNPLTTIIKAFEARPSAFPEWAQEMLTLIADEFNTMSGAQIMSSLEILIAEVAKHQAAGFKDEAHETKKIEQKELEQKKEESLKKLKPVEQIFYTHQG